MSGDCFPWLPNHHLNPPYPGFRSSAGQECPDYGELQNPGLFYHPARGHSLWKVMETAIHKAAAIAAGFVITGKAADIQEGKALAESLLDRGAAHFKMRELRDWC